MARELGSVLAMRKIGLIFGGAKVGLMGELARAVLDSGGTVIGIIPSFWAKSGIAFSTLKNVIPVASLQERKRKMIEMSDGFIALPGGIGTLDELTEVLVLAQLGFIKKPCGILNICGFFSKFLDFLEDLSINNFMQKEHRDMLLIDENPSSLIDKMHQYHAPTVDMVKWVLETKSKKQL